MELKSKSKQKEKTQLVDLGSVTRWLSGGTPSRSIEEYWFGDIPWISASTLRTIEIFESDKCVTAEAVAVGSKMAPVGATLLLVRGSALHNEILAGLVTKPVCFNQDVKALVPSHNVFPKFLTYSLLGHETQLLKLVSSAGNTAGVLDTKLVQALRIWVPPKAEQSAIATALSDVDALLAGLDKLIAKKCDIKQTTMQQLLACKTRLPGFAGKWETRLLGEVAEVKTGPFGSSLHERDYVLEGTPIITVEHLGERGIDHRNLPMVSDTDKQRLKAYSLHVGDIVFSRVGSIDRNALIRDPEAGWLFSGRLLRVRPQKSIISAHFLSYQFHGEVFKSNVRNVAVGQTMASLNTKILSYLPVTLPSIDEQAAIATVLGDMDTEIAALEQRREKTRLLRQGIMQELLTGRTRLV